MRRASRACWRPRAVPTALVVRDADAAANLRVGASAAPFEPDAAQVALARGAVAALGLDVAGVDLLADESGPLLLEVNACPGLSGIERVTGRDVAGAIVELLGRRLSA